MDPSAHHLPRRPQLPFRTHEHPEWRRAQESLISWKKEIGLIRDQVGETRARNEGTTLIVGLGFPECSFDDLLTLSIALDGFLYLDDDLVSGQQVGSGGLSRLARRIFRLMNGDYQQAGDHPALMAASEVLPRLRDRQSRRWWSRLRSHLRQTLAAMAVERTLQRTGHIPSMRHYVRLRQYTSGVLPWLDLYEWAGHYEITENLNRHPDLRKLKTISVNASSWINDLYSHHRESSAGEFNLIVVIELELGVDECAAMEIAVEMIESECRRFVTCKNNLLEMDGQRVADEEMGILARYIGDLEIYLAASADGIPRLGRNGGGAE
ncbi:terpene synthase family protein [Nocardia sp. NPDC050408]|uniref:terpene synthase family protein n=1 Tax=Nocardia sp. NPDC050408 TaxID=3364319 RepID=UPI00379D47F2